MEDSAQVLARSWEYQREIDEVMDPLRLLQIEWSYDEQRSEAEAGLENSLFWLVFGAFMLAGLAFPEVMFLALIGLVALFALVFFVSLPFVHYH